MHEGEPLIRRIVIAARDSGADPVVVVLGANAELVAPALAGLGSVTTIVNHEWSRGLSSSLIAGVSAAFEDVSCDGVLVTLADQPFVDAAALSRLIAAFGAERRIVASTYDDAVGVPAVFAREYLSELMQLTGDAGAGSWLRSRLSEVACVPLGPAAADIDVPSDLPAATSIKPVAPGR